MLGQLCRRFSSYNKRTHVPKILKDPKFSRKGILQKKRVREVEHDVSGEYVRNAHLYFSWAKRQALEQEYLQAREAKQQVKLQGLSEEHQLLALLSDPQVVQRADQTVLSLLNRLAALPSSPHREELIGKVLRDMSKKMYQLSLEEVGQAVALQKKHNSQDTQVWQSLSWALRRLAASCIYHNYASPQEKDMLLALGKEVPECAELKDQLQHRVFA